MAVVGDRQLWKMRSTRGVTAVCVLRFPSDRAFPPKWTVAVTYDGKPYSTNGFSRIIEANQQAETARQTLIRRSWVAVEPE